MVKSIMASVGVQFDCNIVSCERIGLANPENSRPLKVRLSTDSAVSELLKNSKNLRSDQYFFNVYVAPDLSRDERIERSKLVKELKQKRLDFPNKTFYIRNKKIHCDDPR